MQKQKPAADGSLRYRGFIDCARKIAAEEGLGSFYTVRALGERMVAMHLSEDQFLTPPLVLLPPRHTSFLLAPRSAAPPSPLCRA